MCNSYNYCMLIILVCLMMCMCCFIYYIIPSLMFINFPTFSPSVLSISYQCLYELQSVKTSLNLNDLVCKLKRIVGSNNFSAQFIKIISIIKRLAITFMYFNRIHAWWSIQSRLETLFSSLIAHR